MTDQEFTPQAEADAAQDALIEQFGIEWLIGNARLNHEGSPLHREIDVTADPPNYEDHYIAIVLPLAAKISDIPTTIDGVRIVIVHKDQPEFYGPM